MPAFDLAEQTATLSRFDVVGRHSEKVSRFVRHVALFNLDNRDVNHGDTVDVVHMGPPLETDQRLSVDVAGRQVTQTGDQLEGRLLRAFDAAVLVPETGAHGLREQLADPDGRARSVATAHRALYGLVRNVSLANLVAQAQASPHASSGESDTASGGARWIDTNNQI